MNTKQAILNTSRDRFGAPSEQVNAQFVARLPAHLHRIKAFEDNYLWMLQDPGSNLCWVVDPGDGKVLIEAAASRGLQIVGVLLTHHHADHQGLAYRTGLRNNRIHRRALNQAAFEASR